MSAAVLQNPSMDYMPALQYGLGEGFWEFCGSEDYNDTHMDTSYCMYGQNTELYDPIPQFVHNEFLPSPESDQENYIGYYDTNIQDFVEDCDEPRPKKPVHQRKAANMRERRRMKSINDAFDHLRKRIPFHVSADRRISKVDTLRLAIRYISYLGELMKQCSDNERGGNSRNGTKRKKVILRYRSELGPSTLDGGPPLIGHSLSCSTKDSDEAESSSSTHSAKIWMPHQPNASDLRNLSSGPSLSLY